MMNFNIPGNSAIHDVKTIDGETSPFVDPQKLFLVGGLKPSEKYEFVNWDDDYQYMGK